jgi:hypothetical protein
MKEIQVRCYQIGEEPSGFARYDVHEYDIDGSLMVPVFDFYRRFRVKSRIIRLEPSLDTFAIFYVEDDQFFAVNHDVVRNIFHNGVGYEWHGMAIVFRKAPRGSAFVDLRNDDLILVWSAMEM